MTAELADSTQARASLELLYEISRELGAHLDLEALLARILQLTLDSIGGYAGSILVFDDHGNVSNGALATDGKIYDHIEGQLSDTLSEGMAGWVVRHKEAVLVENTLLEDRWLKREREIEEGESKSAIIVPLTERDRVVGVLTMVHPEEGRFSQQDLELLQAIADQAGIAVENAQLFTAEQNRRQFASTLQEIARSINSSLEPSQVFPLILDQLSRVIKYDSASIFVHTDHGLQLVAANGFEGTPVEMGLTLPDDREALIGRVLHGHKPVAIHDVTKSDDWDGSNDLVQSEGIRSWIGAPLWVRDEAVGILTVDNCRPFAYGETEIEMVDAFANQAATAVANAQMFSESQRQMKATVALVETARVVSASLDLEEVLERILEQTMNTLDIESASIALIDPAQDNLLEFRSALGIEAEGIAGLRLKVGEGIAGWVAEKGESVIVPDVHADPRFFPDADQKTGYTTQAIACVPIQVQDETLGVLEAINPIQGSFGPNALEILTGIAGMAGTAIEHARLFAATQAARQRYAGLFEDSIDPILISDLDGKVTDTNIRAQTFLGRSSDELVGMTVDKLHDPSIETPGPQLSHVVPGLAQSYETSLLHRDGTSLPVEIHVKRMEVDEQSVLQWILRDISERRAIDRLKLDLTSMIFHDLRSPLGNIISSLEVLRTEVAEDDEIAASVISVAQRSSRRLSRLIDSLLDIGLLEDGEAVLQKAPASVLQLVIEAKEEVAPVAEAKGQSLTIADSSSVIPDLEFDVDMIRRVVINLVENAVKYTPTDGKITISIHPEPELVKIAIRDTGPGIQKQDQERVFEKFAQVARTGRSKGLGIGLAFCRLAVEAHGGKIWVESEQDNGSTFIFTLPV